MSELRRLRSADSQRFSQGPSNTRRKAVKVGMAAGGALSIVLGAGVALGMRADFNINIPDPSNCGPRPAASAEQSPSADAELLKKFDTKLRAEAMRIFKMDEADFERISNEDDGPREPRRDIAAEVGLTHINGDSIQVLAFKAFADDGSLVHINFRIPEGDPLWNWRGLICDIEAVDIDRLEPIEASIVTQEYPDGRYLLWGNDTAYIDSFHKPGRTPSFEKVTAADVEEFVNSARKVITQVEKQKPPQA
jgi:hypothetical protein